MEWSEVLADPSLQDLPYKIETNEYGNIVMSPASNDHGYLQIEIGAELRGRRGGRTISESSIATAKGVKVADVVWCSQNFAEQNAGCDPFPNAPELCVEIISPSNSKAEIDEKRMLYFEAGASEVWVCSLEGQITFYDQNGTLAKSVLFQDFPNQIG